MNTRMVLLTVAFLFAWTVRGTAQDGRSWEVRGRWVPYPNEDTSFGYHGSRTAAENAVVELKQDYGSGGLLASAPNKPSGLYIVNPTSGQTVSQPKTRTLMDAVFQKIEGDKQVQNSLKDLGVGKTETGKFAAGLLTDPAKAYSEELGMNAKAMLKDRGLDDFKNNVQGAYKRAKDAKDELMGLTGSLTDKQFKEVNDLVAKYNREAASPPTGLEPLGRMLPKMSPVGPDTMKKVGEWRETLTQQFALEKRKEDLDRRKADLDGERDKLEKEWKSLAVGGKPLDPADPKVVSLRERLKAYNAEAEKYSTSLAAYKNETTRVAAAVQRFGGESKNINPQRSDGDRLAGTVWEARGLSSYGGELRFGKDGKSVTHAEKGGGPHPAATHEGTYQVSGDTITMKIKYRVYFDYTGTINGRKMAGTYTIEGVKYIYDWNVNQQ